MVNSYKILGQSCPAGTADTDVYTVPVGKSAVISLISIANLTGAAATYRLAFRKNNATIADEHYHSSAVSVPANTTVEVARGVTLDNNDVVTVRSGTGGAITYQIFGTEITP